MEQMNERHYMEINVDDRASLWGILDTYSPILGVSRTMILAELMYLEMEHKRDNNDRFDITRWPHLDEVVDRFKHTTIDREYVYETIKTLWYTYGLVAPCGDINRYISLDHNFTELINVWDECGNPQRGTDEFKGFLDRYQERLDELRNEEDSEEE